MIELLSSIFKENGYDVVNTEFIGNGFSMYLALSRKDSEKEEYFLLVENEKMSDSILRMIMDEYSSVFYEHLVTLEITDKSFRKNCTMILCCDAQEISNSQLLRFEEDPFIFKKNIITYGNDELASLKNLIGKKAGGSHLNKIIMMENGRVFDLFKNGDSSDYPYYTLLMRIVTKLSIIHYITPENDLDDLNEIIKNNLSDSENTFLDYLKDFDISLDSERMEALLLSDWTEQ